jgi:hypothetical protein
MAIPVWVYYVATFVASVLVATWLAPELDIDGGGTNVTKPDTGATEPVIYGEVGKCPGVIQHLSTNDGDDDDIDNDLLHMIITWGVSVTEILGLQIDDIPQDDPIWTDGGGGIWLLVHNFINGLRFTSPGTLLSSTGFDVTKHLFSGKAVSYVRCEWDRGKRFNGRPNITAHIKGRAVYDPRTDTTAYSDNPALCLLDYLLSSEYGKGMLIEDIDLDSFSAAANVCDTLVETEIGSGEYQKLFTCNIRLDTSTEVKQNVEILLKGMRGHLPEDQFGRTKLIIEQDDPVTPIGIDESLIIGDLSIKEPTLNDRFNRVIVKFKDKDNLWKDQEAIWPDNTQHALFLAQDNNKLLEKSITLQTCTSYNEARQMARILCLLSREPLKLNMTCAPECIQFEIGDIIPITHSSARYDQKPFRVSGDVEINTDGTVQLQLKEHQPYIYDWDGLIRPVPDITLPDPRNVATPTNLQLTPLADSKIQVTWDSNKILFLVQVINDQDETLVSRNAYQKTYVISELEQGTYFVKVYAISGLGIKSDPATLQFTVTTPSAPVITTEGVTDDSATFSATATETGLGTTFQWQFLGLDSAPSAGGIVKSDTFTITGLTADKAYSVQARTVNIAGQSAWTVKQFATAAGSVAVADIRFDQLDQNLQDIITTAQNNTDLTGIQADITDNQVKILLGIANDIDADIEIDSNEFRVGEAESNISTIQVQTASQASSITSLNTNVGDIFAGASNFLNSAIGYIDGNGDWIARPISERILEARVSNGQNSARITDIMQAYEDKNGTWVTRGALLQDVNGFISGYVSVNDGSTSQFDILTENFRVGYLDNGSFVPTIDNFVSGGQNITLFSEGWVNAQVMQVGGGSTSFGTGKPIMSGARFIVGDATLTNDGSSVSAIITASDGSTERMRQSSEGVIRVSRGSSLPAFLVRSFGATFSGGTAIETEAGTGVANFADGVAPLTGKHLFYLDKDSDAMYLLMSECEIVKDIDFNNVITRAEVTKKARDKTAVGCLAQIMEQQAYDDGYVNAVGEGKMWVCSQGGDINQGEWLCSSDTAGHAMRQVYENGEYEKYNTDFTVAKTRQGVDWSQEPNNTKLIAVYYKGG